MSGKSVGSAATWADTNATALCVRSAPCRYLMWLGENRNTFKTENPDIKPKDILKLAGERCNALEAEAKKVYEDLYATKTAEWKEKLAAYEAAKTSNAESDEPESKSSPA